MQSELTSTLEIKMELKSGWGHSPFNICCEQLHRQGQDSAAQHQEVPVPQARICRSQSKKNCRLKEIKFVQRRRVCVCEA